MFFEEDEKWMRRLPGRLRRDVELYKMPLNEMSYRIPQMAAKIIGKTNDIVSWWGLLWCIDRYGICPTLVAHEKGKLKGLLKELFHDTTKAGRSSNIKRNILNVHWGEGNSTYPGRDLKTNSETVCSIINNKLRYEKAVLPKEDVLKAAEAFQCDIGILISLICDGDDDAIDEYIDSMFPDSR